MPPPPRLNAAVGNNVESRRQPIANLLMADSPFYRLTTSGCAWFRGAGARGADGPSIPRHLLCVGLLRRRSRCRTCRQAAARSLPQTVIMRVGESRAGLKQPYAAAGRACSPSMARSKRPTWAFGYFCRGGNRCSIGETLYRLNGCRTVPSKPTRRQIAEQDGLMLARQAAFRRAADAIAADLAKIKEVRAVALFGSQSRRYRSLADWYRRRPPPGRRLPVRR